MDPENKDNSTGDESKKKTTRINGNKVEQEIKRIKVAL